MQVCKTDFTYFRDKSLRQPSLNPLIAMPFVWENQVKKRNENQVAAGDPGEQGEPRGRVRGGRLQPTTQPLGPDWSARKRNAWQVLKSSTSVSKSRNIVQTVISASKNFPQNQPITQVGSKSRSRPSGDSLEEGTGVQIKSLFCLLSPILESVEMSGVC